MISSMPNLQDKVAVVTGGNSGIGLAIAGSIAEAGGTIAVWGRNPAKNAAAVERLTEAGHRAAAFPCDVADPAANEAAFAATLETFGKVDVFVANAGDSRPTPFLELTLDEWRRIMAVNLESVFLGFQIAARHMIERGEGGSLVAVSSTSAIHGAANNEAYGTSKTAMLGLVRALAVGMARHGIRVNALLPGWTLTDLGRMAHDSPRLRDVLVRRTPVRRFADPAEIGPAGAYLADPSLTFHTGDCIVVDGGYTVF
jgi:NAD(P)-dependent dehydrogenase (short-subunit alcohol dehydrogenase family)